MQTLFQRVQPSFSSQCQSWAGRWVPPPLRAEPLKTQLVLHRQRLLPLLCSAFPSKRLDRKDGEDPAECSVCGLLQRLNALQGLHPLHPFQPPLATEGVSGGCKVGRVPSLGHPTPGRTGERAIRFCLPGSSRGCGSFSGFVDRTDC